MPPSTHSPHIPAEKTLREVTPLVIGLSVILTIVLAAANAYLGLFAGMTVSASIPAAVISMAILRLVHGNILQNNAVQTSASAGESLAAGVIFTIPAMIVLGTWSEFHYLETTLIAGFGGALGVLFTIPLRRALIIEEPLGFPEGVATAEVLKVGRQGRSAIRYIGIGCGLSAVFKLGTSGLKLWADHAVIALKAGAAPISLGSNLSPALVAVGYIVKLNIAVLLLLGGAINWLVAIPITASQVVWPQTAEGLVSAQSFAEQLWSGQTRYLGVGAMLVGGLWALAKLRTSLVKGLRAGMAAYRACKTTDAKAALRTEQEIPMPWVIGLVCASTVPLYFLFYHFTGTPIVSAFMAVFMLVFGFLFSAVAAYMAGLVGSSNNPISGVTIATILTAALLLLGFGLGEQLGPPAAILIGGVVCCAAAIGGDNMQDLKAGYLLGATPQRQQIMQFVGVIAAAAILAPVLTLLHDAYGIGTKLLPAPQAGLMSAVAGGVFRGDLPWGMIAVGAGIATAVIIADVGLERTKARFRMPVLAVAVGIYLPFELSIPIFIGGLIAHFAARTQNKDTDLSSAAASHRGLLYAAGLITGEALIGIILAIPIAITRDPNVLATGSLGLGSIPGIFLLALVAYYLYRTAAKPT